MTKFIVEYIWTDNEGNFRSKCRTIDSSVEKIPTWNYDGSSTGQSLSKDSEITLHPVHVTNCPFRLGNYLALCETRDCDNKPAKGDYYQWAKKVFSLKSVEDIKPWYGLEQEYFIMDQHGVPLGLKTAENQGRYYCSVGTNNAYGRFISDQHYQACLHAGLEISGTNSEVAPGQWEFQIGPVEGIHAANQLMIARFLLIKVAEMHNLCISFHPKPACLFKDGKSIWNGSGCHVNFSTEEMRNENGCVHINKAITLLSKQHQLHMKYYGTDNHLRMTGQSETSSYDKFSAGRADRSASVRIPNQVYKDKCGYFEDRRPASNCNPYIVTALIASTVLVLETVEID